ncbi:MAG: hypothetical protein GVY16_00530 [Planctomycetes bacterium]|jgi:hypothetical protein|nr:hypothetical protein [Planctomycetota bacterium]
MSLTLEQLEFLASEAAEPLLAMDLPTEPLAAQTKLRKQCDAAQATAVGRLKELRRRAVEKLPASLAAGLLVTDVLLQQASGMSEANLKAGRLVRLAGACGVWDLCSGLGVDALALAATDCDVTACDLSDAAVLCMRYNARQAGLTGRLDVRQADVTGLEVPADAVVHIDPDRRDGGRRSVSMADYSPAVPFLRSLVEATGGGCMKLSAAMDAAELDGWPVELEWISRGGTCRQLLAWWGGDAVGGRRKATVIVAGGEALGDLPETASVVGSSATTDAPTVGAVGEWIIEPDPAVLAADLTDALAAEFGWRRFQPGLDWLTGEVRAETPLAASFRVLREMPGREQDIARALRELDAGLVEIKPRGVRLDTDRLQRRLRGRGSRALAVLWTRRDERQVAFIAERV